MLLPSGVTRTGDVEMHLRATDFVHHGHAEDPAYAQVILHVVWEDDRPAEERGTPTPHAGGGAAIVEVAPHLKHDPRRLEALVARGPSGNGTEPCGDLVERVGSDAAARLVRVEGQRRLAERAWRALRLAGGVGAAARPRGARDGGAAPRVRGAARCAARPRSRPRCASRERAMTHLPR